MKFENSYTDIMGNITDLTESELTYFYSIVEKFAPVMEDFVGRIIEIENRNHETMERQRREALGIYYSDKKDDADSGKKCFITIDNYFIHECYEEKFSGKENLTFSTLEETISHEIAHFFCFRHGKKHREMTARILKMVS